MVQLRTQYRFRVCHATYPADHDILGGDGYITNLHVTDLNIEGPVPEQTCAFKWLKELDLDGGNLTGTIPQFLSTCFPIVNEIDLSYNHVSARSHGRFTHVCDVITTAFGNIVQCNAEQE